MTLTQENDVRRMVRGLLSNTEAFGEMPELERKKLAGGLVKVLSFLTDPKAGLNGVPVRAQEEVGSNDALKARMAKDPKMVGEQFKAGAAREQAQVFKQFVDSVDFPKFVSNLIEGVYSSIVSSSIKQMQAYSKLLEGVVKSVDQFAKENISMGSAREFVAKTYPDAVTLEEGGEGGGRLKLREDVDDLKVPDFKQIGIEGEVDINDEEGERRIAQAAQLAMARQRQQQLATMVLLGINRIVVTEGEIKASVLFDTKSRDTAARQAQASTADTAFESEAEHSFWGTDSRVETRVSSAYSAAQDQSSASMEAKAKLSGSVTVKFKSETFPLERIASPDQLGAVQDKGGTA